MRTHLKSGSKKCYKAVFDFQFFPQERTTLMHSETNLLQRSALWCYVGGRADVYSEDFLQTAPSASVPCSNRPPEAINQQSNHCCLSTNQTNVVFRPIHPNKQNQLIQLIISCRPWLTPLSTTSVHYMYSPMIIQGAWTRPMPGQPEENLLKSFSQTIYLQLCISIIHWNKYHVI